MAGNNTRKRPGKQVTDAGGSKGRKVVSARGETVDFDLLKIKAQMGDAPKTIDIVARERFIDKRRRRTNRKTQELLAQQAESKRYAEDAMKQQQEQKNNPTSEIPVEVVVGVEAPKVEDQPNKLNRKLNK